MFRPDTRRSNPLLPSKRVPVTGHPNDQQVIPAQFFAEELELIITRLNRSVELKNGDGENIGALSDIASRLASAELADDEDATPEKHTTVRDKHIRRLYAIRSGETRTVRLDLADRILLDDGQVLGSTDLPVLPAGMAAAREMVTVYHEEVTGEELDDIEVEALARTMYHISLGVLYGWDIIDLHICNGLEAFFKAGIVDRQRELAAA